MSFLNLWVAAAVAAVVVPALLLLYFLKLRRREQLVPSTLLWKRAVEDLRVNAPFQRLRRSLLLLLQLLVLAAALLALARPIVETSIADEARLVLLIDRSGSMNAREGDGTRLDLAKEQAIRFVKSLNRHAEGWRSYFSFPRADAKTQVLVIAFSDRAGVVAPFTTSTRELIEAIQRITPTDGATGVRDAIDLAEAYLTPGAAQGDGPAGGTGPGEGPARLVLISDGRIPDLDRATLRASKLELVRVGGAQDNVGITGLRAQRQFERPEQLDVFVSVENFGPQPVTADLSIYVDGVLTRVEPVRLAAAADGPTASGPATASDHQLVSSGSARALGASLVLNRAAVLEVRLSRADALDADNAAYAVVPAPKRHRVLVVSDGKYPFVDSVMRGLPLQEYVSVTPARYEADRRQYETNGRSNYDVVVLDKCAPPRLPTGAFLFLGAVPAWPNVNPGATVKEHRLIWWDRTHPVLRHVALDHVFVAESRAVKLPPAAEALIEGPEGPVLFRYAEGGRHGLVLTFAIEDSTWWSKLSFGVFMYNAIRYLGGGETETGEGPLRPGGILRIPVGSGDRTVRVLCPDGGEATVTADAAGVAYYGGTERAGVYRVADGLPGHDRFAVNVADPYESDIAPPRGPLTTAADTVGELAGIRTATPEVWRWFAGAAVVLVLLEWWVYNRRVAL